MRQEISLGELRGKFFLTPVFWSSKAENTICQLRCRTSRRNRTSRENKNKEVITREQAKTGDNPKALNPSRYHNGAPITARVPPQPSSFWPPCCDFRKPTAGVLEGPWLHLLFPCRPLFCDRCINRVKIETKTVYRKKQKKAESRTRYKRRITHERRSKKSEEM